MRARVVAVLLCAMQLHCSAARVRGPNLDHPEQPCTTDYGWPVADGVMAAGWGAIAVGVGVDSHNDWAPLGVIAFAAIGLVQAISAIRGASRVNACRAREKAKLGAPVMPAEARSAITEEGSSPVDPQ